MILPTVKEAEEASKNHSCQNTKIERADDPRKMFMGWFCSGCGTNWQAPMYNRDGKLSFTDIWERSCQFSHRCTDNGVSFSVQGTVLDKVLDNFRDFQGIHLKISKVPRLKGDRLLYAEKKGFKQEDLVKVSFNFGLQWTADPDTIKEQAMYFVDGMRLLRHIEKHPEAVVRLDVSNEVD